ncbi:hypothetical protein [Caulobacter mirabilis]|uniref:Uncharacterized protein n=1 Tax=Caulobacter mirabilis TaxID=69666 RepID=A0A2D2B3I2_9CAUL|nr:hypothetical protein [Caulobacter mirabilis]ATQ44791.1 hypothetical protein CSW64_21585 [Caulobacter mirabilis]
MSAHPSLKALWNLTQPEARRAGGVADLATMFGLGGRPVPHNSPSSNPARGDGRLPTLSGEATDVH